MRHRQELFLTLTSLEEFPSLTARELAEVVLKKRELLGIFDPDYDNLEDEVQRTNNRINVYRQKYSYVVTFKNRSKSHNQIRLIKSKKTKNKLARLKKEFKDWVRILAEEKE